MEKICTIMTIFLTSFFITYAEVNIKGKVTGENSDSIEGARIFLKKKPDLLVNMMEVLF